MKEYMEYRNFMKSKFAEDFESDQERKLPQPPLVKGYDDKDIIIQLPKPNDKFLKERDYDNLIKNRKSNRKYDNKIMRIEELSYLLWSTQGVFKDRGNEKATFRPVPSGGARHPMETYLAINNVEGLRKGIYRYLPLNHEILFVYEDEGIKEKLNRGTLGQKFVMNAGVVFIWTCIPYRGEWRYADRAHKVMLLDAGHICQNLYLTSEGMKLGACAIAAYDQEYMDDLLKIDGEDEYTIYMASVGYKK